MRLIKTDLVELKEFLPTDIPKYAILSHRWTDDEVSFQEMQGNHTLIAVKKGFKKILECCLRAESDGFEYVWIDTCCIDKTSSAELSESINSMYMWYYQAQRCYAYLADVSSVSTIATSQWFTRGWTLQELLAPLEMLFLDQDWNDLGTKYSLQQLISQQTGIPTDILSGSRDISTASIAQRMSWAAKRRTTRLEDIAYSLMGIFGINMPLLYGEGEYAFIRLQQEISRISNDHSLLAWTSPDARGGVLATSPAAFEGCENIIPLNNNPPNMSTSYLTISSIGIHLDVYFMGIGPGGLGLAILNCKLHTATDDSPLAIYIRDLSFALKRFERVQNDEIQQVHLSTFRPSQYAIRKLCIETKRLTSIRKPAVVATTKKAQINSSIFDIKSLPKIMRCTDPNPLIINAARQGMIDDVWLLLTRGDVTIDYPDDSYMTALQYASQNGHLAVVTALLDGGGASVDSGHSSQRTPLSWAASNGHDEVVKALLQRGAMIGTGYRLSGKTPLHYAAENGHTEAVGLLLAGGSDITARDANGKTALRHAVLGNHEATMRLLCKLSLDIIDGDDSGLTLFDLE